MDKTKLQDEPLCPHCNIVLDNGYTIDNDYNEDEHIIKNIGTCPQCKRQFVFKEYFEYKGSIVENEIKQL